MAHSKLFGFLLVLLLSGSWQAMADNSAPQIVGSAFDQRTGEFLYSEHHFCAEESVRCAVEYRNDYGNLIARKELDYSPGPFKPSLVMVDYRSAQRLSFGGTDREDLVVDAGFDNFVRSKWVDFTQGGSVKFPFLVAGLDKPLNMLAEAADPQSCEEGRLCLEIQLDSWFLGLLVEPIQLSYSLQDRRLLRFRGVSNIRAEDGGALDVEIQYHYGDEIQLLGRLAHYKNTEVNF
jgi:hypothetical protein